MGTLSTSFLLIIHPNNPLQRPDSPQNVNWDFETGNQIKTSFIFYSTQLRQDNKSSHIWYSANFYFQICSSFPMMSGLPNIHLHLLLLLLLQLVLLLPRSSLLLLNPLQVTQAWCFADRFKWLWWKSTFGKFYIMVRGKGDDHQGQRSRVSISTLLYPVSSLSSFKHHLLYNFSSEAFKFNDEWCENLPMHGFCFLSLSSSLKVQILIDGNIWWGIWYMYTVYYTVQWGVQETLPEAQRTQKLNPWLGLKSKQELVIYSTVVVLLGQRFRIPINPHSKDSSNEMQRP